MTVCNFLKGDFNGDGFSDIFCAEGTIEGWMYFQNSLSAYNAPYPYKFSAAKKIKSPWSWCDLEGGLRYLDFLVTFSLITHDLVRFKRDISF